MKIKSNLLDRLRMRDYVKLTVILMRWIEWGEKVAPLYV